MSSLSRPAINVVVTDANIIINLLHVDRLNFLGKLPPYSFVVPEQVIAEVCNPAQSAALTVAIANAVLSEVKLLDISELTRYADPLKVLGNGEAACLALAETRGWYLASDERKLFLREATKRIGRARILNTAGIFVKAIRLGLLTVDEADQDKKTPDCSLVSSTNSVEDCLRNYVVHFAEAPGTSRLHQLLAAFSCRHCN